MTNELGIEIKCENCPWFEKTKCAGFFYPPCKNNCHFTPSNKAYEARIRELQGMVMQAAMVAEKVPQLERRVKELTEQNKKLKGEI